MRRLDGVRKESHIHHDASLRKALSRDLLPLMFGEPPYIVDIEVELEKTETVTIEFASDLMPYTSLHFLKQVKLGLWDGAQIARNAGHVIQAGPGDQRNHFKEAGIKSVAFQEYSEEFPHEKHTLGLAGRPGGPDFYFSIVNNVKNHGPGGQKAYNLPKEADPAFAKITAGKLGSYVYVHTHLGLGCWCTASCYLCRYLHQ